MGLLAVDLFCIFRFDDDEAWAQWLRIGVVELAYDVSICVSSSFIFDVPLNWRKFRGVGWQEVITSAVCIAS